MRTLSSLSFLSDGDIDGDDIASSDDDVKPDRAARSSDTAKAVTVEGGVAVTRAEGAGATTAMGALAVARGETVVADAVTALDCTVWRGDRGPSSDAPDSGTP